MSTIKVNAKKGTMSRGLHFGRRWDDIVNALVKSGEIYLHKGEKITEIEIDPEYGIYFKIET